MSTELPFVSIELVGDDKDAYWGYQLAEDAYKVTINTMSSNKQEDSRIVVVPWHRISAIVSCEESEAPWNTQGSSGLTPA